MSRKGKSDKEETAKPPATGGRFSYEGLERVMHEKARLSILSSLAAHAGGLLFYDLKQLCSLTDGNLSRHLAVLSEAGLVEIWKGTTGPRPQTMCRLTVSGRQRFGAYVSILEKVVADAQLKVKPEVEQQHLSGDWVPA